MEVWKSLYSTFKYNYLARILKALLYYIIASNLTSLKPKVILVSVLSI